VKGKSTSRFRLEGRVLPVGVAIFALCWVAQSLVDLLVFGESGALGAFFPTGAEELFDRRWDAGQGLRTD
jgi:hypothetical protein